MWEGECSEHGQWPQYSNLEPECGGAGGPPRPSLPPHIHLTAATRWEGASRKWRCTETPFASRSMSLSRLCRQEKESTLRAWPADCGAPLTRSLESIFCAVFS